MNATQAAIRAGYSKKSAYSQGQRMLKNVEVKSCIDERLAGLQSAGAADAEEVLEYLTSVMRGEQTEQTLRLVGKGTQRVTNIEVSAKDRLRAAELIGKRYGMFKDGAGAGDPIRVIISGGDKLED